MNGVRTHNFSADRHTIQSQQNIISCHDKMPTLCLITVVRHITMNYDNGSENLIINKFVLPYDIFISVQHRYPFVRKAMGVNEHERLSNFTLRHKLR